MISVLETSLISHYLYSLSKSIVKTHHKDKRLITEIMNWLVMFLTMLTLLTGGRVSATSDTINCDQFYISRFDFIEKLYGKPRIFSKLSVKTIF